MITQAVLVALIVAAAPTKSPCPEGTSVFSRAEKLGEASITRYMCKTPSGGFTGPWVAVYKNGKYAQTGSYDKAGKLDGELVYFNEQGVRLARTNFVHGAETGERAAYHKNGELQSVGPVIKGQPDGLWAFFHDNGQKESEGRMSAGQAEGPWTYWDAAGKVLKNGDWKAGTQSGVWFERADAEQGFQKIAYRGGKAVVLSAAASADEGEARCSQVSAGWWILKVSDLGSVVAGWPNGLGQATVTEANRGGSVYGYRISSIRPTSLVASCGFQDGDVIRAINDVQTKSFEAFRTAAERARVRGTAVFHLERDHRIVLIRIEKR